MNVILPPNARLKGHVNGQLVIELETEPASEALRSMLRDVTAQAADELNVGRDLVYDEIHRALDKCAAHGLMTDAHVTHAKVEGCIPTRNFSAEDIETLDPKNNPTRHTKKSDV